MNVSLGRMVTKYTGIVSRKGCMRLAFETGTRMVDRAREVGHNLTKSEVERVFAETLPKSCRPKILTNREELVPYLVKSGAPLEEAKKMSNSASFLACCVSNGTKKRAIYIPFEDSYKCNDMMESIVAHELEHALEFNNRPKLIIDRKFKGIKNGFKKLLGRNQLSKEDLFFEEKSHEYEEKVIKNSFLLGSLSLKDLLKQFVDIDSKGSRNNKMFRILQRKMNTEIPAYTVGGIVDEYKRAAKTEKMEISPQTKVANVFKEAKQNIKQNRLQYWKNKLLGRLGRPTVYHSDKDLMRLANNKGERQVLRSLVKDMNMQEKGDIFNVLKNPKLKVDYLIDLSKELSKDGKMIYSWNELAKLKSDILLDKEFMKYLKYVGEDGEVLLPSWKFGHLNVLSTEKFDALKKILVSVDEADLPKDVELIPVMNSPKLDLLKKFIDEPKCTRNWVKSTPLMEDMDYYLSRKEIIEVTEKLRSTNDVKEVNNMIAKLIDLHDDSSQKLKDFMKTIKSTNTPEKNSKF